MELVLKAYIFIPLFIVMCHAFMEMWDDFHKTYEVAPKYYIIKDTLMFIWTFSLIVALYFV